MGFFKRLFVDVADEFKKNLEDSKNEMLKSLGNVKKDNFGGKKLKTPATSKSSKAKNDDDNVRVQIGRLRNGVLVINDNISELGMDSLEDYKLLRKIVFPASLKKVEEGVIDDQKDLEEIDLSKVTKLKEIPEDFISGKTNLRTFKVPAGVEELGDGILGDSENVKEVYVPISVYNMGYLTGHDKNNIDVYLFSEKVDVEKFESDVKTLYVLPECFDKYAKALKELDSNARIRTMPESKMNVYDASTLLIDNSTNTKKTKVKKVITSNSFTEQTNTKKLWWIDKLELLFDGNKYAIKYKNGKEEKVTRYIYDDVELMGWYHARLTQKRPDGSIRYGIVLQCSKFFITNCEYTKVTFLDPFSLLAIDEDGDKYVIGMHGEIYSFDVYRERVIEENEEED